MVLNDKSKELSVFDTITETIVHADGSRTEKHSPIVKEHFIDLIINEQLVAKIVCTPENLAELVIGRMAAEGYIRSIEDVESLYICEYGSKAKVFLRGDIELVRTIENEPTCCAGNQVFLANVSGNGLKRLEPAHWEESWVFHLANDFVAESKIHKSTKGTHCCYLGVGGKTVYSAEDIGRHNAMDKAIGYAVMQGLDLASCVLFTTGRVPTDMVKKAVGAGIPLLVSKAVPTDQAIEMAKYYNLSLICKAWPDSFVLLVDSRK